MYSRFGNPYMRRWTRVQSRGGMAVAAEPATYKGITWKSVFLVLLTIGVAVATEFALWATLYGVASGAISGESVISGIVIGLIIAGVAGVVMLVGSIVMIFNPEIAKWFGPLYCVMQGVFLGAFAAMLNIVMPGVSLAALLGTGVVFAVCLVFYKLLGVRIKSRFMLGLVIAAIGIFAVEALMVPIVFVLSAVGWLGDVGITTVLAVQAIIALFCVFFATFTVFFDIQNIDMMVQMGADKKFEWVLAFSLTTGLIYLYMEILELIVRVVALLAISKGRN